MRLKDARSIDDLQVLAERHLPLFAGDYIRAGTGTLTTLDSNLRAFSEVTFRPRVAVPNQPEPTISTTVLGQGLGTPVMIAPTGGARFVDKEGEIAGARAAEVYGGMMWITTFSGFRIEEIAESTSAPLGFQLYYPGSREGAEHLIERARNAGCCALALTLDTVVGPRPEFQPRSGVILDRSPGHRPLEESLRVFLQALRKPGWSSRFLGDGMKGMRAAMVVEDEKPVMLFRASEILMRRTPVWSDVSWVREQWQGPLVLKGILTPEDAQRAVEVGADAIVVSNHGGNVLDGSPPSLAMLPQVAKSVGDEIDVLFDSGIRRGSDVVKALALGAKAVLVGRSWLWGLAAGGQAGVEKMMSIYNRQIGDTLLSLGCGSIEEIHKGYVHLPSHWSAFRRY